MNRFIITDSTTFALLLGGLMGCGTTGPASPELERATAERTIPAHLDIGFDPVEARAASRVGDRVVAHIVAETGEGIVERYVTLRVVGLLDDIDPSTIHLQHPTGVRSKSGAAVPHHSSSLEVSGGTWVSTLDLSGVVDVAVHDGAGTLLASRRIGNDLMAALATNGRTEPVVYSSGAAPLFDTVLSVPQLDDLLMDVAKAPPIWTVLGGLHLELDWPKEGLRVIDDEFFELPSIIRANGHVALEGRVLQGTKASPYLLSAGVRRIEARHPGRADRSASIEIVGARRGDGGVLFGMGRGGFSAPDARGLLTFDPRTVVGLLGVTPPAAP